MTTKMRRVPGAVLLSLLVAGCATGPNSRAQIADNFGEANRQTMMAQVINPTPEYDTAVPESSGDHAAKAIDRYRKDQVKKPDKVKTTNAGLGGSGSSAGSGN